MLIFLNPESNSQEKNKNEVKELHEKKFNGIILNFSIISK